MKRLETTAHVTVQADNRQGEIYADRRNPYLSTESENSKRKGKNSDCLIDFFKQRREPNQNQIWPAIKNVERLEPKNIEKAANIITEAFIDYPLPGQYIMDTGRRRKALREMFKVELRKAFMKGSVYTLGGDFQEVAIWKQEVVPESDLAYINYARPGTLKLLFHLRLQECIRLFKALRNVSNTKLSLNLPANTVELYIVGVNPANQGQGRLSRLLKPVLEVMQEQGRPVLVMTNTESNKAIYEHLGFKLVKVLNDKDADCISYYLVK